MSTKANYTHDEIGAGKTGFAKTRSIIEAAFYGNNVVKVTSLVRSLPICLFIKVKHLVWKVMQKYYYSTTVLLPVAALLQDVLQAHPVLIPTIWIKN